MEWWLGRHRPALDGNPPGSRALDLRNRTQQRNGLGKPFSWFLPVKAYLALAAKVRPIISRSELNGCLVPCEATTSWSWLCLSRPSFDFVLDWRESWSSIRSSGSACVPWLVLGPYLSRWPIGMRSIESITADLSHHMCVIALYIFCCDSAKWHGTSHDRRLENVHSQLENY
jgi:hypothetical protein